MNIPLASLAIHVMNLPLNTAGRPGPGLACSTRCPAMNGLWIHDVVHVVVVVVLATDEGGGSRQAQICLPDWLV